MTTEPSLDGFSVWQVRDYGGKLCMVTLPNRYQVKNELGSGTGGIVWYVQVRISERIFWSVYRFSFFFSLHDRLTSLSC